MDGTTSVAGTKASNVLRLAYVAIAGSVLILLGAGVVGFSEPLGRRLNGAFGTHDRDPEAFCKEVWKHGVSHEAENPHFWGYAPKTTGLPAQKPHLLVNVGKTGTPTTKQEFGYVGLWKLFQWQHVHPMTPKHGVYKDFAITVRDPVSRTKSAFGWLWAERVPGFPGKTGPSGIQKTFFECCPSFDRFARVLDEDSVCGSIARAALHDPSVFRGHLNRGMCYYAGGMIDELSRHKVHVIRLEHHRDDFHSLVDHYGLPRLPASVSFHLHENSDPPGMDVSLSEEGRNILTRHLDFEYWVYNKLLAMGGH